MVDGSADELRGAPEVRRTSIVPNFNGNGAKDNRQRDPNETRLSGQGATVGRYFKLIFGSALWEVPSAAKGNCNCDQVKA